MSHMYLLKRGNTYYFNRRIRTKMLRLSLGLSKKSQANIIAARLFVFTNSCIRRGMNYEQIKLLAKEQAQRLHDEWLSKHFAGHTLSDSEEFGEQVSVDRLRKAIILGELPSDELQEALSYIGYFALRERTQEEWKSPQGVWDSFNHASLQGAGVALNTGPLSSYLADYLSDLKANKESLNESTLEKYRVAIMDFIEIVGDKKASEVDRSDGKDFRSKLLLMPIHRNKQEGYKGKTVGELLAMNLPREQCLSTNSISHRLKHTRRFFEWLLDNKLIDHNPLKGVTIESTSQSYPPYTAEDLALIFKSPVYNQSHPKCSSIGTRSRWWLMLLAAYTGARIGELCQLTTADIDFSDDVLCISINDDDFKTLKTGAAKRYIPVHPMLLNLGFEDYLESHKKNNETCLLPSIPSPTPSKKAGAAASDWFGQKYRNVYLPTIQAEGKVFHSFRHTFIQAALKSDVELLKLQQMVGHESKEMGATMSYLGDGYSPVQLMEQLQKVQFPSIDVKWLQTNSWRNLKKP